MKTALLLAALVALTVAGAVPGTHPFETKPVDAEYALRQKKVLLLLENIGQPSKDADWYKLGYGYDIEANRDDYENKKVFEEFVMYYKSGFLPKHRTFSVVYERMRNEAVILTKLLYYAKDFEIFYKTAAFARVHFNSGIFLYAFYAAMNQRLDTYTMILPEPYEMDPQYFVNTDTFAKAYRIKMQNGLINPDFTSQDGIIKENDYYVIYSNYSSPWFTGSDEQKLSYFTEDIGMNAYNYYLNIIYPFWMKGFFYKPLEPLRGVVFYYLYQQLIGRYYLERLSNGMSEIPKFSWNQPLKTGYTCQLYNYHPFIQRDDYYLMDKGENENHLNYLISYEHTFQNYLDQGRFKAFNQEVDLSHPLSMNFVGNYWFTNVNLYDHVGPRNFERYYELIARHVLAASPEPVDKYSVWPSALELYQTSLRDPVFYQLYSRILNFIYEYKGYMEPYNNELQFDGVKINNFKVDKLVTYFEYFDFNISNAMFYSQDEIKGEQTKFKVRQPCLNHKPFSVSIDVTAEVPTEASIKIFLGPKFDSNGYPLKIEENWMNLIQLDWFTHKLTPGANKIERNSKAFHYYRDDGIPITEVYKMLESGKVPVDMSEHKQEIPNRMMLPRGRKAGFPCQIYVVVYPYIPLPKELKIYTVSFIDAMPLGFPFDRPASEVYLQKPNIHLEDVLIYHEGDEYPYAL